MVRQPPPAAAIDRPVSEACGQQAAAAAAIDRVSYRKLPQLLLVSADAVVRLGQVAGSIMRTGRSPSRA